MAQGTHTPEHLKIRSRIVLDAAAGTDNNTIERCMRITAKKVKLWRDRYSVKHEELQQIERDTPHKLRKTITGILSDEQRPGGPAKFTDGEVAAIIAMACEDPQTLGLPFSHWSPSLLQAAALQRGIVASISVRQVGRFLKKSGLAATPQQKLAES
jgi:putative transposase